MSPKVSVIIPTYKRGHLLTYVLDALTVQTINDFEVLMIVKPSGDGTEQIIAEYAKRLTIKIVIQKHGYFTDALNLGLKNAEGDILVFLDDDAIPFPNLILSYILSYSTPEVGGVAGNVIPVTLNGNKVCPLKHIPSEILPIHTSEITLVRKLNNRSPRGLENYLLYISKAGFVSLNSEVAQRVPCTIVNSLFAKGVNMSVSSKAVADFQFPASWILGFTCEQYLGWCLWKKGYRIIFNSEINVYHIHHGQTLSRYIKDGKKATVLYTEERLLFYRLYGNGSGLSLMHRIVFLLMETIVDIKNICLHKDVSCINMIKNRFFTELIGLRWFFCKKFKLKYSLLTDLEKILS